MPFEDREELVRRIENDLLDGLDEELELEIEDRTHILAQPGDGCAPAPESHAQRVAYFKELFRLQGELVKLQDWIASTRQKAVIIFEGRDAAGKGGVIKRIRIGRVTLGNLPVGQWRYLGPHERF